MNTERIELLAPAGDMEKFYTALHFGADAVYMAGHSFGLRAYASNFNTEEIAYCCDYAHKRGRKVYVTVNIYAREKDFITLGDYLVQLEKAGVDAIIVSDPGIILTAKEVAPNLTIHLSTQANATNSRALKFWLSAGVKRVVCAREVSLCEIKQMKEQCPEMELEVFGHGAMCISYSGRCLMSDFLTGRGANRGECVQACRWKYTVIPEGRTEEMSVFEDERGTYIFNSRDLNMISHIDKLAQSGVCSLKIEGRMKSPFYVGTVVNAYRRALNSYYQGNYNVDGLEDELKKTSHRAYTTGFFLPEQTERQYYESSKATATSEFIAVVKEWKDGVATIEMRNRFKVGDELEILARGESFGKRFTVSYIHKDGEEISECKVVQQIVKIPCPYPLEEYDILRADVK